MKLRQKLFFHSLLPLYFLLNSPILGNAPSSLSGKKITVTVPSKYYDMEWYVLEDGTKTWVHELEDGEWELDLLTWTKTSSDQGTIQLGIPSDYLSMEKTFSSSSTGSFTYNLHESDDGGLVQIVDSGSGTFTSTDFDISEIPFDNYFEDQFSDQQVSQAIWPLGTAYGITIGLKDNALQLTGTLNDAEDDYDQRWYAFSASSILSTANDWKVSGSSFAKIDIQNDFLNYQAATGVNLRNSKTTGLEFEISIGLTPWGVRSEIYVGDFDSYQSQYYSAGSGGGVVQKGDFRVLNDSSNRTLTTQYLSGSEWESLYQLNWDTGVLNDKINNSEIQLNNWTSFSSEFAFPTMDFVIPHTDQDWNGEDIQVILLEDGELGFTSFSVTTDEDLLPKAFEDLSSEVSRVDALIAQSTSDPEANLLRGLYALLEFVELDQSSDNSLKDFAVSLGVEESIRNFVLSDVSTLENYNFDLSDSFQAKELAELFEYSLIPALESADAYFSKIGSNQTITLSSEITGSDESITVDSADVYVLRSIVNILGGLASLQAAYDWNLNAGEIEALDNDPSSEVTAEKIRDLNSNFGGIRSASLLTKSKDFLKTAVETYALASPLLRASSRLGTEDRLFSLASEDLSEESDFKGDLDELYLALDSSHNLKEDGSTTDTLSLSNFFAGQVDIPTLLPELVGDQFEADQVSDPTLGGLFPNWDQARISALMLDAELSIPQPTGWMWFDSYPWVYSHEENSWIYLMPYNSKLLYFSVKHNAWLEMSATSN